MCVGGCNDNAPCHRRGNFPGTNSRLCDTACVEKPPPGWEFNGNGGVWKIGKRVRVCFDSRKIVEILEHVRVGFVSITRQIFGTDCVVPRSWQLKVVQSTH